MTQVRMQVYPDAHVCDDIERIAALEAALDAQRAALLALAERLERPETGMSNLDVAREIRRIAG